MGHIHTCVRERVCVSGAQPATTSFPVLLLWAQYVETLSQRSLVNRIGFHFGRSANNQQPHCFTIRNGERRQKGPLFTFCATSWFQLSKVFVYYFVTPHTHLDVHPSSNPVLFHCIHFKEFPVLWPHLSNCRMFVSKKSIKKTLLNTPYSLLL